jgi:hypothetical protein
VDEIVVFCKSENSPENRGKYIIKANKISQDTTMKICKHSVWPPTESAPPFLTPPPILRNSAIAIHAVYGILLHAFDICADYIDGEV